MKIRCAAFAALAFGLAFSTAHADFINRYADWTVLDKTNKSLYAAGLVDGGDLFRMVNLNNKTSMNYMIIRTDGMIKCIVDNKLNGELLAKMIDNAYEKDVKQWPNSPSFVLGKELEKLCQPWVERSIKRLETVLH